MPSTNSITYWFESIICQLINNKFKEVQRKNYTRTLKYTINMWILGIGQLDEQMTLKVIGKKN